MERTTNRLEITWDEKEKSYFTEEETYQKEGNERAVEQLLIIRCGI